MEGRLRDEEIGMIAAAANKKIDIPLVKERMEGIILFKSIKLIDNFLWKVLPDELYDLYRDVADGLGDKEAEELKDRLISIVNKHVDLPFLSKKTEKELFEFVLSVVCDAIKKGKNLLSVL